MEDYSVWSKALTHRKDHTTTHYDSAQVMKLRLAPRDLLLKYLGVLDGNSSNATY